MNRAELFVKRLWLFRFAHLLISFLVATVMVAVMLFHGYLLSLSGEFSGRLIKPEIPADMLCRALPGVRAPVVTDAMQQLLMSVWTVQVPAGRVEMAAVYSSQLENWVEPAYGEAWLPASQRGQVYIQQPGDKITLVHFNGLSWTKAEAQVAGYYDDGGFLTPVLVNPTWVFSWVNQTPESTILAYPEQASKQLQRWVSENPLAELYTHANITQSANDLIGSLYSGGYIAVLMGGMFLALGFIIMAMLVFLDSRTELAILKALGIPSPAVGRVFWLEFGVSAMVGAFVSWGVITWLHSKVGSLITVNWPVFRTALFVAAFAYGLAMLAPARLAKRAQVNELLLRRPILLWSQVISVPHYKDVSLDDLRHKGWSCLKLNCDEDGFAGIILRKQGSSVREGETLAWLSTWFDMGEKKYVAPHDGILELVDLERGVLAISAA